MLRPGSVFTTCVASSLVGMPAMLLTMISLSFCETMVPMCNPPSFMVMLTQLLAMVAPGLMIASARSPFFMLPSVVRSGPLMASPILMP